MRESALHRGLHVAEIYTGNVHTHSRIRKRQIEKGKEKANGSNEKYRVFEKVERDLKGIYIF